jgi:hypothetical protein
VELVHPFFGITPEAIGAVNMNIVPAESSSVIDRQVHVAAKHQRIIASPSIRINDRTSTGGLRRQVENGLCTQVLKGLHFYQPFPVEDTEDGKSGFGISRTTSPASILKIGFLRFNFTVQERVTVSGVGSDRLPNEVKGLVDGGIRGP